MTIDVTPNTIYFVICALLLVLQVHQYWMIGRIKKEINEVWSQLGILLTTLSIKITEMEKRIEKSEKNEKSEK